MAIHPVLRMGHPLLNQRAEEVRDFNTPELGSLIADMFETMRAEDGAGLAMRPLPSRSSSPSRRNMSGRSVSCSTPLTMMSASASDVSSGRRRPSAST